MYLEIRNDRFKLQRSSGRYRAATYMNLDGDIIHIGVITNLFTLGNTSYEAKVGLYHIKRLCFKVWRVTPPGVDPFTGSHGHLDIPGYFLLENRIYVLDSFLHIHTIEFLQQFSNLDSGGSTGGRMKLD